MSLSHGVRLRREACNIMEQLDIKNTPGYKQIRKDAVKIVLKLYRTPIIWAVVYMVAYLVLCNSVPVSPYLSTGLFILVLTVGFVLAGVSGLKAYRKKMYRHVVTLVCNVVITISLVFAMTEIFADAAAGIYDVEVANSLIQIYMSVITCSVLWDTIVSMLCLSDLRKKTVI